MPVDLAADEAFELKLIFLRELGAGYAAAAEALNLLRKNHSDARCVGELRAFFHKIAGTAEAVDLALLGRLAAACEAAGDAIVEGTMQPSRRSTQIFADGLAGVASVLEGQSGAVPATLGHAPAPVTDVQLADGA